MRRPPVSGLPRTGQTVSYKTGDDGDPLLGQKGNPITDRFTAGTGTETGTVTDIATGLMWEQKTNDGTIHDVDNRYNWLEAFNDFLNKPVEPLGLNMMNGGIGFAGHYDWRIPNVSELRTIVNYGAFKPAIYQIFNTPPYFTYGGTGGSVPDAPYWSSTRDHELSGYCWFVDFYTGVTVDISSGNSREYRVRGVRGGEGGS